MKPFLLLILVAFVSCGKSVSRLNSQQNEVIDLLADEDGDGISNADEIKRGLDRLEFNRPKFQLNESSLFIQTDTSWSEWKLDHSEMPELNPMNFERLIPIDIVFLSHFKTKARYEIEKLIQNRQNQKIKFEGVLNWDLPDLFSVHNINVRLAIYQYHSGILEMAPVSQSIPLSGEGNIDLNFEIPTQMIDSILNLNNPWDFVLIVENAHWSIKANHYSWDLKQHELFHHIESLKEGTSLKSFANKVDRVKDDLNFVNTIKSNQNNKLSIVNQKDSIQFWGEHDKKNILNANSFAWQTQPIVRANHEWQRVDIKFLDVSGETKIVTEQVQIPFIYYGECHSSGGRKQLCGGAGQHHLCQVQYQVHTNESGINSFFGKDIIVETVMGWMPLSKWIEQSGAEVLEEGALIRWEGIRISNDRFTPLQIKEVRDQSFVRTGIVGDLNCGSHPGGTRDVRGLDRRESRSEFGSKIQIEVTRY